VWLVDWSFGGSVKLSVGWLVVRLFGWLVGCLVIWLFGWLVGWLID